MAHKVEQMAYTSSDGMPWHGLGVPVGDNMSTLDMMIAAGVNWEVVAAPTGYQLPDGTFVPVVGGHSRVLLRADTMTQLTTMGAKWKPTQNAEAIAFFDSFIRGGSMHWNTMGCLAGGKYIFALAEIDREVNIGGKGKRADNLKAFLLLALPHQFGKAMIFKFTGIRVVCWNTMTAAIGGTFGADRMNDGRVTIPHSVVFNDEVKALVAKALGLVNEQLDSYAEAAKALSKVTVTDEQLDEYFAEVLTIDANDYQAIKAGSKKAPKQLEAIRASLIDGPGAQLLTADHTLWGGLNAVTHAIDHKYGKGDTRLKSAWFGNQELVKQRAMDLALARV